LIRFIGLLALFALIIVGTMLLQIDSIDTQSEPPRSTASSVATVIAVDSDQPTVAGSAILDPLFRKACEIDAANARNAAEESSLEDLPAEAYAEVEAFSQMLAETSERLAASLAGEHLHAAALLASDSEKRLELFEDAYSVNPNNAQLVYDALGYCIGRNARDDCAASEWARRLQLVDSENSDAWRLIATQRYQDGDESSALVALRRAANSATSNSYYFDKVELFERSLAAVADMSYVERANMAFGLASMSIANSRGLFDMCREEAPRDGQWAEACLEFGRSQERKSKTLLGMLVALNLQRIVLEKGGETEEWERVVDRQARIRPSLNSVASRHLALRGVLMLATPRALTEYLATARVEGEANAEANLTSTTLEWLQKHPECLQ
jgi:tetratricopeptide (TPR) repeat protein